MYTKFSCMDIDNINTKGVMKGFRGSFPSFFFLSFFQLFERSANLINHVCLQNTPNSHNPAQTKHYSKKHYDKKSVTVSLDSLVHISRGINVPNPFDKSGIQCNSLFLFKQNKPDLNSDFLLF